MTQLELIGLDGTNPLHVLATYGALLLSDDEAPGEPRLGWVQAGPGYHPCLDVPMSAREWVESISSALIAVGREATSAEELSPMKRRLSSLKSDQKKRVDAFKAARTKFRKAKPEDKSERERDISEIRTALDAGQEDIEAAQRELAAALGFGLAHLGDIIGVAPDIYRLHADRALTPGAAPYLARQLAALGSDGCLDLSGQLTPTPLSFGNGASGQCLLKDFRALSQRCDADAAQSALLDGLPKLDGRTSLNWSPSDLRAYAHRYGDPANDKTGVDPVTNALAYIGLGLLPVAPRAAGPEAVAFPARRGLIWPIWTPMIGARVLADLLAEASSWTAERNHHDFEARGIIATFFSARVNPSGKRNYLSPARPA